MARLMRHVPVLTSTGWILLAKLNGFASVQTRLLAILLTAAGFYSLRRLAAANEATPAQKEEKPMESRFAIVAVNGSPHAGIGNTAINLARDLAQAIREKRRYPATDADLRFYQFMGNLVQRHRGSIMNDDYAHWEKHGLFNDFETYIQQKREKTSYDPEIRKAWMQEMITRHKAKREGRKTEIRKAPPATPAAQASTCRELMKLMPLGFDPSAARGVEAVYQFDVSGAETFQAHLKISGGACSYHEGPAPAPGVVIRTPGEVWLAIARGELDGQQAFLSGRYTAEGDLALLLKLQAFFPERAAA